MCVLFVKSLQLEHTVQTTMAQATGIKRPCLVPLLYSIVPQQPNFAILRTTGMYIHSGETDREGNAILGEIAKGPPVALVGYECSWFMMWVSRTVGGTHRCRIKHVCDGHINMSSFDCIFPRFTLTSGPVASTKICSCRNAVLHIFTMSTIESSADPCFFLSLFRQRYLFKYA